MAWLIDMNPTLNQPGHRPDCVNHSPVQDAVACHSLNRETGQIERKEWVTPWLKCCPHRRAGGNAVLYGWDCSGCRWAE